MKRLFVGLLVVVSAVFLHAQSCDLPLPAGKDPIIFSLEQEKQAGEVIGAQIEVDADLVNDPAIIPELRRIGERLAQALPAGSLQPQWFLVDSSQANAFTVPGGRIYVTRKLITLTKSEDELAGVMAHELGHMVTRQPAIELTRLWTAVLKTGTVGSKADIEAAYNKILDSYRMNPKAFKRSSSEEDKGQHTADQIAAYILARANYSPTALSEFWDRFAETNNETGSWLSDLFGTTKPDSKRLREMLKTASMLPPSCVDRSAKQSSTDFTAWRDKVVAYSHSREEAVHGVIWRKHLSPGLESEVTHLLFSPDGKYILAQTSSTIFVLARDPLAYVFQIQASEMNDAMFTPDSKQIVFYDSGLRVEKWEIASQKRVSVNELYLRYPCIDSALSPTGDYLACVQVDLEHFFPLQVTVLNVASGEAVYTKKNFYEPRVDNTYFELVGLLERMQQENPLPYVQMRFSPDGHYLVVARGTGQLALDASRNFAEIKMAGVVQSLLYRDFGFAGPDRMIGLKGPAGSKSVVVRFPDGEPVYDLTLGRQRLDGATRGDYALLRPVIGYPVGMMDLKSGKIVEVSRFSGMDVYDDTAVLSMANGDIALAKVGEKTALAKLHLPEAALGYIRAATLSPDFSLVAMSQKDRGGVWDLKTGERVFHVRGFRGAWFGDNSTLYALFPPTKQKIGERENNSDDKKPDAAKKEDPLEDEFSAAQLDVASRKISLTEEYQRDWHVVEAGEYVLNVHNVDKQKPQSGAVMEVREVRSPAVLWSRKTRAAPYSTTDALGGNAALMWALDSDDGKEILKSDAALRQRVQTMKKDGVFLVEIVDLKTGSVRSRFPLDTGNNSIRVRDLYVSGQLVVLKDSANRILLFSLNGEPKGHLFGDYATSSPDGRLLCVEEKPGVLTVLDSATLDKRDEFTFPSWIALARFSPDHKRLAVLTADQTYYVLDTGGDNAAATPAK